MDSREHKAHRPRQSGAKKEKKSKSQKKDAGKNPKVHKFLSLLPFFNNSHFFFN